MAASTTAGDATFAIEAKLREAFSGLPNGRDIIHDLAFPIRNFVNGTGTGKLNLAPLVASQTLTASSSDTWNLANYTPLTGGSVTTLALLKILWIYNTGTVAIAIGGAGSNALVGTGFIDTTTAVWTLAAGDCLPIVVWAGITVDSTHRLLKILNTSGSTSATYTIFAAGSSS